MKFIKVLLLSSFLGFVAVGCVRPQGDSGPTSEVIEKSVPTQDTLLKDLNKSQRIIYRKVVDYFTVFNQKHDLPNDKIDENKFNVTIFDKEDGWEFHIYEVPPAGEVWPGGATVVILRKKDLEILKVMPGR